VLQAVAPLQAHPYPDLLSTTRLRLPRDSTPYARTLEESAGPGWLDRPDLSYAPGAGPRVGTGVQVRMMSTLTTLGGPSTSTPRAAPGSIGASPTVYEVTISPGTGFNERFLMQETGQLGPRPLLVVFHKFGVSHYDALLSTSFFEEARRRGWYCVAPLGGGQTHFSDERSHIHTEAVLEWTRANFSVDTTRIFAVGFSMGGGAAMNYAARHLDPTGMMVAAVFDQSGILSHEDTYPQSVPSVQQMYDNRFGTGAPGSASPWLLQRGSVFSFDPFTLAVVPDTDLGRNLLHVPTNITRTTGDVPYLITQNDLFQQHLLSLGASPATHLWSVINYPGHSWDAVSEMAVCNWLRRHQLTLPDSGNTLAHEDGRFFDFNIEQDAAGSFTPFVWNVNTANNTLDFSATRNLARVRVHTLDAGLSPLLTLGLTTATADGLADEFVLQDFANLPTSVLRDGVPTGSWFHDSLASELTLFETDGSVPHVWSIVP
jgi:pimeloyl-ACP methyl ester carboxylesterase